MVNFAAISGVLAGFCVTFIALILGGRVAQFELPSVRVTYGEISVLFLGVSTALFICSSELFLLAKEYDVFSLPKSYRHFLKENVVGKAKEKWEAFEDANTRKCRLNEKLARDFYNAAIFLIFFGLLFILLPYNVVIAALVFFTGVILESWQMVRR